MGRATCCSNGREAAARPGLPDISNGAGDFADARHSELITKMPAAYAAAPWIEVEAKNKERALEDLRRWWQRQGTLSACRSSLTVTQTHCGTQQSSLLMLP